MRTTFSSLWFWQCFQTLSSMCTSLLHLNPKSRQAPEEHLWCLPNLPSPPECPGYCKKEKQLCREEGTQLLHQLDITTEPLAKAWFLHPLPSVTSAPQARLLRGVPGSTACYNDLFLHFGPASCDISIRMTVSGRGGVDHGLLSFHKCTGFEQYLLEELLTTLEAILVASVQPRGWHSSF